jgi:hypothetical protein
VKVLSDPILARTDDSDGLKRMPVTDSAEVEKVMFIIGADLTIPEGDGPEKIASTHFVSSHICTILDAVAKMGSVQWCAIPLQDTMLE